MRSPPSATLGKVPIAIGSRYNHPKLWRTKSQVLKPAAALYAAQGAEAAIAFLGSRTKFAILAPAIKAQVQYWDRAQRRLEAMLMLKLQPQPEAA